MAKLYKNTNKKSPRFGKKYSLGTGGSHVYTQGGKKTVIGGRKPAAKPPYDPLQPLGGKDFSREVKNIVGAKYDPQQRELASQQRISAQAGQNRNDYYNGYLNLLANLRGQQQAGYAQAQQGVTDQVNTSATQDEQNRQKLQGEQQASAQLRGATVDPNTQAQAQQASQARRAIGNAGIAQLANRGAAQNTYSLAQEGAAAGSRVKALDENAAQGRQLQKLSRDLTAERGQYTGQVRGQLRDTERTYALNRQAYGLKVFEAQQQAGHQRRQDANTRRATQLLARDKRTKNRLKTIDQRIAAGNLSEKQRHDLATERTALYKALHPSKGGGGGGKGGSGLPAGITPTKAKTHQVAFDNAVQAYQGQKDFNKVYDLAQKHRKAPKDLAEAIALRSIGRFPSKQTASKLYQKYGVRMKSK